MFKFKKPKLKITFIVITWIFVVLLGLTTVYIRWLDMQNKVNTTWKYIYTTIYRPVWGLCVCWVIWSCHYGYGGIVNQLLSLKYFVPLSRITYGMYLFHMAPQIAFHRFQRYTRYLSHLNMVRICKMRKTFLFQHIVYLLIFILKVYDFFAHMTVSIALGFIASIMFEAPFVNLEKILFHRKKAIENDKSKKNQEKLDSITNDYKAEMVNERKQNSSPSQKISEYEPKDSTSSYENKGFKKDYQVSQL